MKFALLMILLLPSCANASERLKLQMALEDYYDTQAAFARMNDKEIAMFQRLSKP